MNSVKTQQYLQVKDSTKAILLMLWHISWTDHCQLNNSTDKHIKQKQLLIVASWPSRDKKAKENGNLKHHVFQERNNYDKVFWYLGSKCRRKQLSMQMNTEQYRFIKHIPVTECFFSIFCTFSIKLFKIFFCNKWKGFVVIRNILF